MKVINTPRIWEFDVDNTLILWDRSAYPNEPRLSKATRKGPVELVVNTKNCNLLVKLAKIGWYIRVHSGSGVEWAEDIVKLLKLEEYVDEVCAKPLGRTDDQPPGEGLAYQAYRELP